MASLTYSAAQSLLAPYISSQGSSDPSVATAINFVNERFITSGDWKGNRFITSFTAYLNSSDGNYYFDTTAGVESVMKVIAIDTTYNWGEIVNVLDDWYQFNEAGTGWLDNQYSGATQIIRIGNKPSSGLPSGGTGDIQTYRIVGKIPEDRSLYCLVRRGYVPLVNPTDVLIPSNRNAYRYGVQAYNYENTNELERAQVYWDLAYKCLNEEMTAFEEGSQSQVEIQWKAFAPSNINNLV